MDLKSHFRIREAIGTVKMYIDLMYERGVAIGKDRESEFIFNRIQQELDFIKSETGNGED